jgi:hypothetical protein
MSHVSTTAHYNLPIYGGSDIINPLTDVNGTNEALDTAIYEVAQELASGVTDIADVKNKVGDASLDTASQNLSGAVNELKSAIDTQAGDITDIEANVGTLQSQMATTTGNITTLNTTVAGLQTEVSGKASQTAVNTLATKVGTDALITTANNLSGAVNELANDIDSLDAGDIDYDNTTSGLSATDVQSAIDEVNAKFNSPAPDVTITADGVKTLATLFGELANAIDLSKLTSRTVINMRMTIASSPVVVRSLIRSSTNASATAKQFDWSFSYDGPTYVAMYVGTASSTTGSSAKVATLNTDGTLQVRDETNTVANAGDKFEIYY